jgi:hypothetical protein
MGLNKLFLTVGCASLFSVLSIGCSNDSPVSANENAVNSVAPSDVSNQNSEQTIANNVNIDSSQTPALTLVFDTPPTKEQVSAIINNLVKGRPLAKTMGQVPYSSSGQLPAIQNGEKYVILGVQTGNATYDGTNDESAFRIGIRYNTNDNTQYEVYYNLNTPDRNDLERGTYQMFFYLVQPNSLLGKVTSSDQIMYTWAQKTPVHTGDGWYCAYYDMYEYSIVNGYRKTTAGSPTPYRQYCINMYEMLDPPAYVPGPGKHLPTHYVTHNVYPTPSEKMYY